MTLPLYTPEQREIEVSARIAECKANRSTRLDLSELGLTEIPEEVLELGWLTHLDLGYNDIEDKGVKALAALTNLTYLHLQGCVLDELCEDLWNLPSLETIHLYDCNIAGVPSEILGNDCLPALRAHIADLKAGSEPLNDIKLMVLGNGQIGKTQICRRLRGERYDETVDSTHSIHVSSTKIIDKDALETIFYIWDFGGQDIYLGTHSLFLRSRAIFPVVWIDEPEDLTYHEYGGLKFQNMPYRVLSDQIESILLSREV